MSPTLRTSLCLAIALLGAALLFAQAARAEEDPPSESPPAQSAEDAPAEEASAASIGRDLLATDVDVRRRAIDRLLTRVRKGRDLEAFFDRLGKATADWANRRERLMEVWIEQAVHGNASERDEAARLLSALGPAAIRRLAGELRHARAQGGTFDAPPHAKDGRLRTGRPAAPVAEPKVRGTPGPEEKPKGPRPVSSAHIYNVRDLRKRGLNAVQVRSLLQKAPDAREVKHLGGGIYVVTASKEGHLALRIRLEELRTSIQTLQNRRNRARTESKDGRLWQVVPTIYRVPRRVITQPRGRYGAAAKKAGLPQGLDPRQTEVRTGTALDAGMWMRMLQQGPDGVESTRAVGEATVAAGGNSVFVASKERAYRKGLTKRADGHWEIEMGALRSGIELDIGLVPEGKTLTFYFVATRSEVAEPIPTIMVQRKGAAPIEIDRPEWSRTRARITFKLPVDGGGAFLSLGGLGSTEEEHLIVVLRVTPVEPRRAK